MKNLSLFIACILLSASTINAQETKIIQPILVDKSALSGIDLKKIDLKDEPEKDFYQKNLYWGKDIGVFVVSTENWNNKITDYPFDEFVYMYQGEAVVKPNLGANQVFYSGDYFFAPRGYDGEWEIKAGNYLHYELSVITTKRADSIYVEENPQHTLFSKSQLSGNAIVLDAQGYYSKVLQKGTELTISLHAEAPSEKTMELTTNEQLIQVLSGAITIWDTQEKEHKFYTGDFFILPRGFSGKWKSEGHQLAKYLSVEKTMWVKNNH